MHTTVFLIRHGAYVESFDPDGRRLNPFPTTPLRLEGIEQMRVLAGRIGEIDELYTSPYTRTLQSARILEEELRVPFFHVDERLRDSWTPGWCGKPVEELKAVGGDVYSAPPRSADQEPLANLYERIYQAYISIVSGDINKRIGLVFHGDPIRMLIHRLSSASQDLPDMKLLARSEYLGYGEAWKLTLAETLEVERREFIGRTPEQFGKGERMY